MLCQRPNGLFWAFFLALLLFSLVEFPAISQAGTTSGPPTSSSSPTQSNAGTPSESSLLKLWTLLKQELIESQADWQTLSTSLQTLSTEAQELRSSLTALTVHYESLASLLTSEIAARTELEKQMQFWRAAAIVSASILAGGITTLLIMNLTP